MDERLLKRLVAVNKLPLPPTQRYPRFLTFHVLDAAQLATKLGSLNALVLLKELSAHAVGDELVLVDAAVHDHMHVLEWLYAHFTYVVNRDFVWSFDDVIKNGHAHVLAWLLQRSRGFNANRFLEHAVSYCNVEIVELLLADPHRAVLESDVDTLAFYGKLAMIEWLDARMPIQFTLGAMADAARGGYLDAMKWLVANRDLRPTKWSSYFAALYGNLGIIEWLFDNFPTRSHRESWTSQSSTDASTSCSSSTSISAVAARLDYSAKFSLVSRVASRCSRSTTATLAAPSRR